MRSGGEEEKRNKEMNRGEERKGGDRVARIWKRVEEEMKLVIISG